jgi:hypothetical protein
MAIDVMISEQLGDGGTNVMHINDEQLRLLEPAFRHFSQRTGRTIDPYGQTAFPHGTLGPLVTALRDSLIASLSPPQGVVLRELIGVLVAADQDGVGLVFDGD